MPGTLFLTELLQKGGPVMYLLLLCSLAVVAITLDRLWNLRRATINSEQLLERAKRFITEGNEGALLELLEETPGPVARVLRTAYDLRHLPRDEIVEGVKETAILEVQRLQRFLPTLATLADISTLLGLLGTILGLIQVFQVIAGGRIGDAEAMAAGIAQALLTTAAGLTIAIPTLLVYHYLSQRVDALAADMERRLHELLNFLKTHAELPLPEPSRA